MLRCMGPREKRSSCDAKACCRCRAPSRRRADATNPEPSGALVMLLDHGQLAPIESRRRSRVIEWIDYRLPIFTFLRRELNEYPTPRNLTYLWNFGSLSGIVL